MNVQPQYALRDFVFDTIQFGEGAVTIVFQDVNEPSRNVLKSHQWTFATENHEVLVGNLLDTLEQLITEVGADARSVPDSVPSRT